jgi:thiol-disulfide isomerase/thioredoxin
MGGFTRFLPCCNQFSFKRNEVDFKLYSIFFKDSVGKLNSIEFINRVLSKDSIKYLMSGFIADTTIIEIEGDWKINQNHYYDIKAGTENKALFRTQMMQFGYLDANIDKRTNQLNEYVSIIKNYPNSNYLLSEINENKSVLKKSELAAMLSQFTPQVLKENSIGKTLTAYLANKKDVIQFENFELEDALAKKSKMYAATAKLNMLVVWASWCSPCRQEIPALKQLHNTYSNKGLTITSISIDENKTNWIKALEEEKMDWKQLIVNTEQKEKFNKVLEVGSIPYVLFVDGKGNLINRTIGVDANSFEEYKKIIEKELKR